MTSRSNETGPLSYVVYLDDLDEQVGEGVIDDPNLTIAQKIQRAYNEWCSKLPGMTITLVRV